MSNVIRLGVICLLATNLLAGNYYVDPDGNDGAPGGVDDAWETIQHALNSAGPGDTVNVRSGVYFEKVAFTVSGNENGYIVLREAPGDTVVIDGTNVPNNSASYTDDLIYIENKDYVKVIGFELRNVNTREGSGIRVYGHGSHIELRDNEIHEIRGGASDGGAMGITIYGADDEQSINHLIIDGNRIHHCDPAYSEALTLNGNVEQFEVTNNIVHDVNNIAIDFIGGESWLSEKYARDGICAGNIVYNARSSYGGGWAAGIYVDGGQNILLENNEVYQSDMGMEVGAENPGVTVSNIRVRKNYLHHNDKAGIVFGGYAESRGRVTGSEFVLNMLKKNDQQNEGLGEIWIQWAYENRVDSNSVSPTSQNIMIYSESGNVDNTFDYNDYCVESGSIENAVFVWQGSYYSGLANYQDTTGQDGNATVCSGLPTRIDDQDFTSTATADYRFFSNYPNPFNPSTTLRFRLNRPTDVRLHIVDVRGRVVRVIYEGTLPPKEYSLSWNGTNQENREMPSGIYFAVLNVGGQQTTQKLTLLR